MVKNKEITQQRWGNQIEYFLALAGGAIGLGNVWRFPYLCYKNGGGAFLIPYFTFMFLGGVPMFLMESALGQFMQSAGMAAWNIIPAFKGVGWCSCVIIFWLNCYYIVILGWALFYLFNSFRSPLPWTTCGNDWNSDCCTTEISVYENGSSFLVKPENCSESVSYPELEFWKRRTLQVNQSPGIDDLGEMRWELVGLVFFAGTKSTGKSVYITSTFPLVMMIILIIRGVTLPGAMEGIKFYLRPDFAKLKQIDVWIDAGTQVFFSFMIGFGSCTAMASYNEFQYNSFKWSIVLCILNASASFFSGFAIFSILGYMSEQTGIAVADIAESGPGLAFIVYPRAVSLMAGSNFWAVLFFGMLLMLGLASHYIGVDGMVAMLADIYPSVFKTSPKGRPILVAAISIICFLIGIPMLTQGGIYVFQLFDKYGASGLAVLWFSYFSSTAIGWFHGMDNFYAKLDKMYKKELNVYAFPWTIFGFVLKYLTPIVCSLVFFGKLSDMGRTTYDKIYEYPAWADTIGVFMALTSMICVPLVLFYEFYRATGATFKERWQFILQERLPEQTLKALAKIEEEEKADSKPALNSKTDFVN